MNYLLKSSSQANRRRSSRKKTISVVAVLVVILIILSTTVAKESLFFIAKPVWAIENFFIEITADSVEHFKSKQALINEKQIMQQQIFEVGTVTALNQVLEKENAELKELLGRKTIKRDSVLSVILVKPPQNIYDILTIDVGTDHGAKIGNQVVADGNIYIGQISEVGTHTSKVTLYSSPGEKRQVVIGPDSVSAEAVGLGGGNFSIFLPREVEVKENDVVVIPSITANVFGIVEKISFEDKDSFQTVLFKSPVNISELKFVEVIL